MIACMLVHGSEVGCGSSGLISLMVVIIHTKL